MRDSLPIHPSKKYDLRSVTAIKYLVVHHTAVEMFGNTAEKAISIANFHIFDLHHNWPGIGYQWFLDKKGGLVQCHSDTVMSYHVASRNQECLGICLEGNLNIHKPTDAQLTSLQAWIRYYKKKYPSAEVVGHKNIALPGHETACPGYLFETWRPQA